MGSSFSLPTSLLLVMISRQENEFDSTALPNNYELLPKQKPALWPVTLLAQNNPSVQIRIVVHRIPIWGYIIILTITQVTMLFK